MSFKLDKDWIRDEFSTSSVCSCPGIIIIDDLNKDNTLWIAIYPIAKKDTIRPDHNFVWDKEFSPGSGDLEVIKIDGVSMHVTKGVYTSDKDRYKGFKITSVKGKTSRAFDHVIHVYANNDTFELSDKDLAAFIKSIKWK